MDELFVTRNYTEGGAGMNKRFVYLIMILVMLVWGLNTVALKFLVQHFPPLTMQALRIFLAGLVLLPFLLRGDWRKLSKQARIYLGGAILFGVISHHSFLALGLELTSATHGTLILALVPLTTVLLGVLFLGERLSWLRGTGVLLGLIGVVFVILRGGSVAGGNLWGDLLVGASTASQAISFIFIKKVTDTLDAKQMTALMFLIGSVFIFGIGWALDPEGLHQIWDLSPLVWLVFFASGILATGLGHMMYNVAIHRLGPGPSAVFINFTPFFALLGAAFFLGEKLYLSHLASFLLIVIGVYLGSGAAEESRWFQRRWVKEI